MLHTPLTNYHLLAAIHKPYRKAYLLMKNTEEFSGKISLGNRPVGRKKDKTKRAMEAGRKTREEIVKWNQMTVLRFLTGETHPHLWPPFEGSFKGNTAETWERLCWANVRFPKHLDTKLNKRELNWTGLNVEQIYTFPSTWIPNWTRQSWTEQGFKLYLPAWAGTTQPSSPISWQPLHTPRLNVSDRDLKRHSSPWTTWLNRAVAAHPGNDNKGN